MPDPMAPGAVARGELGEARSATRQRVLVLGASGFIGRRVVQALAASAWAAPVAASHRTTLRLTGPVESVRLDACDPTAVHSALRGMAGVVNCVAGDADTIVSSARALFGACARMTPPPRIVHLSTMMVYGSATGTVDETAPCRGDWDDYSAAKAEVEKLALTCPSIVQLRPGIVYGPDSPIWSGRIGQWLRQHRLGDLGPAGLGYCNLVHVDDVVEAVLRALRAPGIEGEAFNLSLPSPPTWNEYFGQFATALGTSAATISGARLMLERHIVAPPLKLAEILARSLRLNWRPPEPIRPWLLRLCRHPIRLDVRKAESVLGMRWTPLDQGLRESAAWVLAASAAPTGQARVGASSI